MLDKSKKIEENKELDQKKNLLNYSKMGSGKASNYMSEVSGIEKMSFHDLEAKLENEVIAQLKSEFPGIENSKSFGLLVDAVVNNIKNKDLKISDKREIN